MSFNYSNSANTARKLLAKFGQSMTLVQDIIGDYDPLTGTASNTQVSTTDIGVILPYSNGIHNAPDTLIKQGDANVLINIAVVPKPSDKFTIGADTWTIVNVKALDPSGVNVLYDIQIRK